MTLDQFNGLWDQYQAESPQFTGFSENRDKSAGPTPRSSAGDAAKGAEDAGLKRKRDEARKLIHRLTVMSHIRKWARDQRENPDFRWERFGDAIANENQRLGRKRATTVHYALCAGKNRVFVRLAEVPRDIIDKVQVGLDIANKRQNPLPRNGDDLANMLRVTKAGRQRLRIFQIRACDAFIEECNALARAERDKEIRRKAASARRSQAARCAANPNYRARGESIADEARAMGVKPDTLQKKLKRWKAAAGKPLSAERRRPWEVEGIDRRTWQRRRAKAKAAANGQGVAAAKNVLFPRQKSHMVKLRAEKGQKQRCPNDKSSRNQAFRDNAQVAESHVFESVGSTLDSLLSASAVVPSEIKACKSPPVPSAPNEQGGPLKAAAALSPAPIQATPNESTEVVALAAAHVERPVASITRSARPGRKAVVRLPRATSASFAWPLDAKQPSVARSQVLAGALRGASVARLGQGASGALKRARAFGSHFPTREGNTDHPARLPASRPVAALFWRGLAIGAARGG